MEAKLATITLLPQTPDNTVEFDFLTTHNDI